MPNAEAGMCTQNWGNSLIWIMQSEQAVNFAKTVKEGAGGMQESQHTVCCGCCHRLCLGASHLFVRITWAPMDLLTFIVGLDISQCRKGGTWGCTLRRVHWGKCPYEFGGFCWSVRVRIKLSFEWVMCEELAHPAEMGIFFGLRVIVGGRKQGFLVRFTSEILRWGPRPLSVCFPFGIRENPLSVPPRKPFRMCLSLGTHPEFCSGYTEGLYDTTTKKHVTYTSLRAFPWGHVGPQGTLRKLLETRCGELLKHTAKLPETHYWDHRKHVARTPETCCRDSRKLLHVVMEFTKKNCENSLEIGKKFTFSVPCWVVWEAPYQSRGRLLGEGASSYIVRGFACLGARGGLCFPPKTCLPGSRGCSSVPLFWRRVGMGLHEPPRLLPTWWSQNIIWRVDEQKKVPFCF